MDETLTEMVETHQHIAQREIGLLEKGLGGKNRLSVDGRGTFLYTGAFSDYLLVAGDTPEARETFRQVLEEPSKRAASLTRMGFIATQRILNLFNNVSYNSAEALLRLTIGNPSVRLYAGNGNNFKADGSTPYIDVKLRL